MAEDPLPLWQIWIMRVGEVYLQCVTGINWSDSNATPASTEPSDFGRSIGLAFWFVLLPEHGFPSLFAADASGFSDEFDWTISRKTETTIRLDGSPRTQRHKEYYRQLSVILDRQTGRPLAQRTVDPSENFETVYVFTQWNTQPAQLKYHENLKRWDYEVLPLPPEFPLLQHRRKN